eukprot:s744_g16.t1
MVCPANLCKQKGQLKCRQMMLVPTLPEKNNVSCAVMQAEFQTYVVRRVGYVGTSSCPLATLMRDQKKILLSCFVICSKEWWLDISMLQPLMGQCL